ncbi:hypothetical protein DFH07DRAFT_1008899 [Mycena maculata]|uniref:Uncharacterized protein n=1 Tax=Mycena maculata TaxID=230809 RepID=A0AAD7HGJ9_9AGAR|nr:hypothetical protein DFH07DRAFT_1008899 [Mycena maculata]
MSYSHQHESKPPVVSPAYSRKLGQNELSYLLPSRARGVNDMSTRIIFRAPQALVSPLRLRIVWAIIRVRNSLLACRVEMAPGSYDNARFTSVLSRCRYTPPSSPEDAVEEAARTLAIHHNKMGPELDRDFISGPRKLSLECLSCMDVVHHGQVAPGVEEYHMALTVLHAITDGTRSGHGNLILELLGGSTSPGGPARSDGELMQILEMKWSKRWGQRRIAYEAAARRIDSQNVHRRSIGAHAFPRISSPVTKTTLVDVKFNRAETTTPLARCKAERVTLQNTVFALFNFTWIRTAQNFANDGLHRHQPPAAPRRHLASKMTLALGYGNIVLPAFIPSSADPRAMFWLRALSAQSQMRRQTQSPLLLSRSQILSAERGRRPKAFARQDDEADGTLPPSPWTQIPAEPALNTGNPPPIALLGISRLGDLSATYQTESYPSIEFLDSVDPSRKAHPPLHPQRARVFLDDVGMGQRGVSFWAVWGHFVGGLYELILEDPRSHSLFKLWPFLSPPPHACILNQNHNTGLYKQLQRLLAV